MDPNDRITKYTILYFLTILIIIIFSFAIYLSSNRNVGYNGTGIKKRSVPEINGNPKKLRYDYALELSVVKIVLYKAIENAYLRWVDSK